MKVFGLLSLVLALLLVGLLVKWQLGAAGPQMPSPVPGVSSSADNVRQQSQQLQQQYKEALDAAMQSRTMPDDAR